MLFSPIEIRDVLVPNRVVMPPMVTGLGVESDRALTHYVRHGRGGAGAVVVEAVDAARFADLKFFRRISDLAGAIGETGAVPGIQVTLSPRSRSGERIAPSPEQGAREATASDLAYLIDLFAHAVLAARRAGFEMVQVQGGGGFLVNRFFSPAHNRRSDEWGGGFEGRSRFALKLAAAARKALGEGGALAWRMTPVEVDAYDLADSVELSRLLAASGVDLIDLYPARRSADAPPAELAAPFKEALAVPVAAAGGLGDPSAARAAVDGGCCDLVDVGRALLADPDWPAKVREGRESEIIPCLTCNVGCTDRLAAGKSIECVQWGRGN